MLLQHLVVHQAVRHMVAGMQTPCWSLLMLWRHSGLGTAAAAAAAAHLLLLMVMMQLLAAATLQVQACRVLMLHQHRHQHQHQQLTTGKKRATFPTFTTCPACSSSWHAACCACLRLRCRPMLHDCASRFNGAGV